MNPFLPQALFPVSGKAPGTTSSEVTCDNISLKLVEMVWIVCHFKQAVGHATAITPKVGTAVATCATALPAVVPIWYGNVTTSTNALAAQTAAVSFTLDVGVTGDAYVIFQIDPAILGSSYDCLGCVVAASSQATDIVEVTYWILPRYASAVANQQSYIVD